MITVSGSKLKITPINPFSLGSIRILKIKQKIKTEEKTNYVES